MAWPPPLPGRVRWAWLLGTRFRRWRLRGSLEILAPHVPPGGRVVDVGAGPGYASAMLAARVAGRSVRWLLLDPQRAMWDPGAPRFTRLAPGFAPDWVQADGADLPVRDASADIVLSLGVLCCMDDAAIPGAVSEIGRILKPGGWLLFRVPRRRGGADDERFRRAGFVAIARERPGSVLFQKPH